MSIFICDICNKSYSCYSKLENHLYVHSDIRPYNCGECGRKFRQKAHLKEHIDLHNKVKDYKCEHCEKSFGSLAIMKRHAKRHKFQRIYKCQHCEKSFYELAKLRRHFDTHSGFRQHKCGYCERTFNNYADLKLHIYMHTQSETGEIKPVEVPEKKNKATYKRKPQKLKCNQCGKYLSSQVSLKDHINIHQGTKPHKCEKCDKTFNKKAELKRHLMRHMGQRSYPCQNCERSFYSRSDLTRHFANAHTVVSMFRCSHCVESFYELAHLTDHMQSHFVTDSYMCNYCGVPFEQSSELLLHQESLHRDLFPSLNFKYPSIKIENPPSPPLYEEEISGITIKSEVRKFICTVCLKLFNYKSLLFSHMHQHNGKRLHKCKICRASFKSIYNVKQHTKLHQKTYQSYRDRLNSIKEEIIEEEVIVPQSNYIKKPTKVIVSNNIIPIAKLPPLHIKQIIPKMNYNNIVIKEEFSPEIKDSENLSQVKLQIKSNHFDNCLEVIKEDFIPKTKDSENLSQVKLQIKSNHFANCLEVLRAKTLDIKKNITESMSQVKVKVDSEKFYQDPNEVWQTVKSNYHGNEEVEVVSCDVELTFNLRKKEV